MTRLFEKGAVMKRVLCVVALSLAAGAVRAETIDINLNNAVLHGDFSGPLNHFFAGANGMYDVGGAFGRGDAQNLREGYVGAMITGDTGARPANVTAGLGLRLVGLSLTGVSGGALSLGGQVEGRLPAYNRLGAFASAYWAPGVASTGDLNGYLEYAGSIDYQVIREASVYAGYRQLKVHPNGFPWGTVDTGFNFGIRLNF
jgi:hypothetical protein